MTTAGKRLERAVHLCNEVAELHRTLLRWRGSLIRIDEEARAELAEARAEVLEQEATHMDPHPPQRPPFNMGAIKDWTRVP